MLFADIDHFEQINDRHGHDVGDQVLHLVGATLRDSTRIGDTVGRWGGEEFPLIATETSTGDASDALVLAERARNLVASTWTMQGNDKVVVTPTIGVALAPTGEMTDSVGRPGRHGHAHRQDRRTEPNRPRLDSLLTLGRVPVRPGG